jgi:hypothetical protein
MQTVAPTFRAGKQGTQRVLSLPPILAGFVWMLSALVGVALCRRKKPASGASILMPTATSVSPEPTKTFRPVSATKLGDKINTSIGRLTVLLFWTSIVSVLLLGIFVFHFV